MSGQPVRTPSPRCGATIAAGDEEARQLLEQHAAAQRAELRIRLDALARARERVARFPDLTRRDPITGQERPLAEALLETERQGRQHLATYGQENGA